MVLKIEGLDKGFNGKPVLSGIGFAMEKAELVSIIGPSGAGKTTLLKIIAGLEKPDAGTVVKNFDSRAILVFQDYVLFPTMNVFENVAFGLRARHITKDRIRTKVEGILGHFGLSDKLRSFPAELSAGQKQRVAIARAMVLNPDLLLLDEPFANLDKNLKLEMAEFIRKTQKEYNLSTLLVTHDQQEAFMISDKIGILIEGRLRQYDLVQEVYKRPAALDVAQFLGHVNIVPEKYFSLLGIDKTERQGENEIYARAESFSIEKDKNGPGVIQEVSFAGHFIIYRIMLDGLLCTVYRIQSDIRKGDRVRVKLNLDE